MARHDESGTRRPPLVEAILFDLDGTLLDTAPDMGGSLNELRSEHGLNTLPFATMRSQVSHGAAAMLRLGFGMAPDHPKFSALQKRYLDLYRQRVARETRPFPGMETLLQSLEAERIPWGVVTNKAGWLTEPLLDALGLLARASVVVSGDSTVNRKPHPEPLLLASHSMGVDCERCIYVGDAQRDIEAGNRAGMRTVVALFGYLDPEEDVAGWGADHAVAHAAELEALVFGAAVG